MKENTSASDNELLTHEQLSQILGLRPRTLKRYRLERGMPYIKLSARVIRYRRGDIDRWAEEHSQAIHA
jgi:predicted DNA-binding transcriptional regulator AlpA